MSRIFCIAAVTVASISLAGCGGGAEGGKPVFPASGTVTMFGKPLAGATVAFAPQDKQPTAVGSTGPDGEFVLTTYEFGDGAAEGKFMVVVSKSAPSAAVDTPEGADHDSDESVTEHAGSDAAGAAAQMVPAKYSNVDQTPFSAEVKSSGENVFTFDIK